MLKAIKIRIYPNREQINYLSNLFGSSRFIYNQCLNHKQTEYNINKKNLNFGEMGKYLVSLKTEFPWLRDVHSKVLQQSLIDMITAYNNFFKHQFGFPKFKNKMNKQSVRFPIDAIGKINGNRINIIIPLKDIHFKCSKKDEKHLNKNKHLIKSGTLSKSNSNKYYFSILIDRPVKNVNKTENKNNIVGIDLGIKDFVITSDGELFKNIKIKRNNQQKLRKLHRNLTKKKKGSSNRDKARIKLAKFYDKLNNQKEYYLHEVANQLLNENQVIVMEDLNVKGMMKNHNLARSIQELSLNRFKNILTYKSKWQNKELIFVDRFFPSSKLCSNCGTKNDNLTLKDRTWKCVSCDIEHDRDYNASLNILNEGKRLLKLNKIGLSSPELTLVESKSLDTL